MECWWARVLNKDDSQLAACWVIVRSYREEPVAVKAAENIRV